MAEITVRDNFKYDCLVFYTSQMNEKQINDFISVQCEVFKKSPMTRDDFKHKYEDNIYGDSIIVLLYDEEGNPAAARALWRNDVFGGVAYQPCDTAVCSNHRRRGLFVVMTKAALEVSGNALIYNYPNDNSYPQYMKLGWKDYAIQYVKIFTVRSYEKEDKSVIDDDYLNWWIKPRCSDNYGYAKKGNKLYLVRKLNDRGRYFVFGRISENAAKSFNKVKPKLMIFHSNKKSFYNKPDKIGCKIVSLNADKNTMIPNWKTDVL